jgi:hypothetical protein
VIPYGELGSRWWEVTVACFSARLPAQSVSQSPYRNSKRNANHSATFGMSRDLSLATFTIGDHLCRDVTD